MTTTAHITDAELLASYAIGAKHGRAAERAYCDGFCAGKIFAAREEDYDRARAVAAPVGSFDAALDAQAHAWG